MKLQMLNMNLVLYFCSPIFEFLCQLCQSLGNIEPDIGHRVVNQFQHHGQHGLLGNLFRTHLHEKIDGKQGGHTMKVVVLLSHG